MLVTNPAHAEPPSAAAPSGPTRAASARHSLVLVYAGYLLRYVYLLLLIPYYGRVLGAEQLGHVLTAMTIYQIVWMLAEGGLPAVGARDVGQALDRSTVSGTFARQLAARGWAGIAAGAIGAAAVFLSPVLSASPGLGLIAVAAGLMSAFNLGWFFGALLRFGLSVKLEILGLLLNLALIFTLVRGPGDAIWVLGSLLISGTICNVVAYVLAAPHLERSRMAFAGSLALLRESIPLGLNRAIIQLLSNASTYLLGLYAPVQTVGYFGSAERLVTACLGLLQPVQQVVPGLINHRLAGQSVPGEPARRLIRRAAWLYLGFGGLSLLGIQLFAPQLVRLAFGEGYEPVVPILRDLSWLLPLAAATQYLTGCIMTPLKRDLPVTVATLAGALLLVAASVVFLSADGASAAALIRVVAQALTVLLLIVAIHRSGLWTWLRP